MMPRIDVSHTLARLEANLELLPKERLAAAVRAANRTMTTVRAAAARELRDDYPGLKAADLKARLRIIRATRNNPTAAIVFSGRRIALYGKFGMRSLGKWGVRFTKLPWRLETVSGDPVDAAMLARAFRNRGRGGRANVFARHTRVRQSHEVLVAPGLARALTERKLDIVLLRITRNRFAEAYVQEAKFRLSQR